ncbi:HAAS signaling domain-containing protein [Microtetraspora malaysiensis]|uniref:HAAS signaling domain-containing protein n=1 Tax=Microtetraspora malaysiensis TaxID=161358 RepID=UPI003D94A376
MTNDALPEAAEAYLRALDVELSDAPPDTAREIVEDVRAHIADALDSGRTMDQALAGLGSPQAVAGQARDELALPDGALDHAARAGRALRVVAVALGVLTAVCVSFLLRSTALALDLAQEGPDGQSIMQRYGPGLAMLTLLPALIAAVPFALPARARGVAGVVGAVVLTALTFVWGEIGLYYFPLVLLLWAATIVPSAVRRGIGRVAVRSWHLAAAAFVALPGLLAAFSAAAGKVGLNWVAVALFVVGPLVLGVLCACGIRAGYAVTALAGALVMILAMVEPGFLFAAFWLLGGLYLMIGASGFVSVRAGTRDRVEQRPPAASRRITGGLPG